MAIEMLNESEIVESGAKRPRLKRKRTTERQKVFARMSNPRQKHFVFAAGDNQIIRQQRGFIETQRQNFQHVASATHSYFDFVDFVVR